jgi:hypothetical protein
MGKTYPELALEARQLNVARYFLNNNGNQTVFERLLFIAAEIGSSEIVLELLKRDIDANIENDYGVSFVYFRLLFMWPP